MDTTPAPDKPLHCGECGTPVTSITRGRQPRPDGTLGPAEPARFGCGHLAGKAGSIVQMDLASMPHREAYWPDLPDASGTIAGTYDRPEVWQDLQADEGGVTPYGEGDDRG